MKIFASTDFVAQQSPHSRTGKNSRWSIALISVLTAAGCASTAPVAYTGLASAALLKPNVNDKTGHVPYAYSEPMNWQQYRNVIIDPVKVYQGANAQFDKVSADEQLELARYMQSEFAEKLKHNLKIVQAPGPDTLRLHLTLTAAKTTPALVGTFTRFDLVGGPYNVVQGVRGKEGAFIGSVTYAEEIYDAQTDRLIRARIIKQFPNAMNVKASFGALGAAKTGIEKGAEELAGQTSGKE